MKHNQINNKLKKWNAPFFSKRPPPPKVNLRSDLQKEQIWLGVGQGGELGLGLGAKNIGVVRLSSAFSESLPPFTFFETISYSHSSLWTYIQNTVSPKL